MAEAAAMADTVTMAGGGELAVAAAVMMEVVVMAISAVAAMAAAMAAVTAAVAAGWEVEAIADSRVEAAGSVPCTG